MTDNHWRHYAACRDHPDPDLWFPDPNTPGYRETADEAITICAGCPVQTHCHTYATNTHVIGIWAGKYQAARNHNYRSPMEGITRKRAGLQPCGTKAAYQRHIRRGETVCNKCRLAINTINRERNARLRDQGTPRRPH